MILTEQTEMEVFPEEALATGRIRQSKSPLRAPVFFIKMKDGKLHFVQDYLLGSEYHHQEELVSTPPSSTTLSICSRMCTTSPS
jgi:hypothetical protein